MGRSRYIVGIAGLCDRAWMAGGGRYSCDGKGGNAADKRGGSMLGTGRQLGLETARGRYAGRGLEPPLLYHGSCVGLHSPGLVGDRIAL